MASSRIAIAQHSVVTVATSTTSTVAALMLTGLNSSSYENVKPWLLCAA